ERANPLYQAYTRGFDQLEPIFAGPTLATAIKIGNPVSYDRAVRTLKRFDGVVEQATEDELAEAAARADLTGMFGDPHTGVGPGDRVGRHLIAEVVLDAQDVRADAFAAVLEAVAVAQQMPILQDNVVVAIGAVNFDLQWFHAGPLEAFRLGLIPMGFCDQAVQV